MSWVSLWSKIDIKVSHGRLVRFRVPAKIMDAFCSGIEDVAAKNGFPPEVAQKLTEWLRGLGR